MADAVVDVAYGDISQSSSSGAMYGLGELSRSAIWPDTDIHIGDTNSWCHRFGPVPGQI